MSFLFNSLELLMPIVYLDLNYGKINIYKGDIPESIIDSRLREDDLLATSNLNVRLRTSDGFLILSERPEINIVSEGEATWAKLIGNIGSVLVELKVSMVLTNYDLSLGEINQISLQLIPPEPTIIRSLEIGLEKEGNENKVFISDTYAEMCLNNLISKGEYQRSEFNSVKTVSCMESKEPNVKNIVCNVLFPRGSIGNSTVICIETKKTNLLLQKKVVLEDPEVFVSKLIDLKCVSNINIKYEVVEIFLIENNYIGISLLGVTVGWFSEVSRYALLDRSVPTFVNLYGTIGTTSVNGNINIYSISKVECIDEDGVFPEILIYNNSYFDIKAIIESPNHVNFYSYIECNSSISILADIFKITPDISIIKSNIPQEMFDFENLYFNIPTTFDR